MTDNEIIKALKHWINLFDGKATDLSLLCTALDLINRQKAEIEELEAEIDRQYEQAKADILGNMSDGGTSCHWCIDQHRTEAIKDFAERLKKKAIRLNLELSIQAVFLEDIDNLVKEMVGDNK